MREVQSIPLDLIDGSPLNVRQKIDTVSLTRSILDAGLIVPLRLRPAGDRYEVRTGGCRLLALRAAGASHADAIVVEGTDEEVIREQWAENEERADYTDYERALKLRQMIDVLGLTQTELAERIGMSRSRIAQLLRMLELEKIVTMVTILNLNERQARAILQAPEADWPALVSYAELHLEERGKIPPASAIEDYALALVRATEIGRSRRLLYETEEDADLFVPYTESPAGEDEDAEAVKTYIEDHDLGWVFDAEATGAGFLTKIGMLTDEELEFCLAHEARPLSIRRLNEETDRRGTDRKPLLREPPTPTADPGIVASINTMVGEPVEDLPARLMEEHGLTEEAADAALEGYRETYPDIWGRCYPEAVQESEEPMTAEEYVADVLSHNPEVDHEELARVTAEMFGVAEGYAQGLIDRSQGQKRGRKPRDPYAARSPVTTCPLCGRTNAEKNRILMVLEEYQATQPGVTLVDWLREVLA